MTLGLGAKAKPGLVRLSDGEALIVKDNQGFMIGADGRPLREHTLHWPSPPEELAYVKPYILSALAPGTVPAPSDEKNTAATGTQNTMIQSPVVQISSYLTASNVQTLPFPPQLTPAPTGPASATYTIRLLTPSTLSSKPSIYLVATPTDRTAANSEGSSIWQLRMRSWMDQIDELVTSGLYAEALSLLHTLDVSILPDRDQRQTKIRALYAVSQFRAGKYDDAINTFLELDLNPAKVVALYPESVAGRLSVPQDEWIPLFGGPSNPKPAENDDAKSTNSTDTGNANGGKEKSLTAALERSPSPTGSLRAKSKSTFASLLPSMAKDDDTASISGRRPKKPIDEFSRSVDALWRYLTDRRPKVAPALEAVNITSAQSHSLPFLSETSVDDLFAIPNVPLSSLTPEQLIRFAQIVDTALFKSYLQTRPSMLGPLCRVPNWCEVSEVEEELRARGKFSELIDLYHGKKMHSKALSLLKDLSSKEDDPRDKLSPSIAYLRKLGPEHQDQVFEWSRWIFDEDKEQAFEIFTSDDVELPFEVVTDYLEKIDPRLAARYIEYVIDEKSEEGSHFHNRLAELYLTITVAARKRKDEDTRLTFYEKLLTFLDSTFSYQPDRLYGHIPDDLYEARAILLGRMGRHGHALELYVYRLRDYPKAEDYCKRIYAAGPETANIFLTLLRIYLRPTVKTSADLLKPALDLISRHSPRLDSVETLQLLPPLVTAKDVRPYLFDALRAPIFDTHVVRDIHKAHAESVAQKLMLLESRRVRITDSRICPHCHKRIGNSVIAVHAPRGEVTHYQCREAFSRKLTDSLRR
ncbi:rab guanyl-nucleotide exchange factor [Coniophora puteana RWD-64-598 SS2]|uniref:Rab guanyl-nucleotide exchange factor n=1 Tax=Coniophora puteana (strain RWD-64-598) TaxID=741705 RepID=A0A5M3MXT0_CONPW|nr:rab guanyl-nucleotide exchange factor [Coniophora puteana RWD-64-598 SS2]EIW83909.1 rab guanyl-nucleotide exchange factor [Coniophora puteana RWD-64-598 SS2]